MTTPLPSKHPLSNHCETLDDLKRLLAEADDDFANGRYRMFETTAELRSLFEEIKVRGRARLDAEQHQATSARGESHSMD